MLSTASHQWLTVDDRGLVGCARLHVLLLRRIERLLLRAIGQPAARLLHHSALRSLQGRTAGEWVTVCNCRTGGMHGESTTQSGRAAQRSTPPHMDERCMTKKGRLIHLDGHCHEHLVDLRVRDSLQQERRGYQGKTESARPERCGAGPPCARSRPSGRSGLRHVSTNDAGPAERTRTRTAAAALPPCDPHAAPHLGVAVDRPAHKRGVQHAAAQGASAGRLVSHTEVGGEDGCSSAP